MSKMSIRFYKDREVRAVWDDETNKWWFSAVDIVAAINEEDDYKKAGNYWRQLKLRNKDSEFVTNSNELKMTAGDGKRYVTAVLDQAGISQLARTIHNKRLTNFSNGSNTRTRQSTAAARRKPMSYLIAQFTTKSKSELPRAYSKSMHSFLVDYTILLVRYAPRISQKIISSSLPFNS